MNDIESLCSHSPGQLISVTIEPRLGLNSFINNNGKAVNEVIGLDAVSTIVLRGKGIWQMINVHRKRNGFINRLKNVKSWLYGRKRNDKKTKAI